MIDYERLKSDLIKHAKWYYRGGDSLKEMAYISTIENASNEQLIDYAKKANFKIEDYQRVREDNIKRHA